MAKLTIAIIQAAISGFETQKQHIDAQIAELRAMQPSSANGSVPRKSSTNKRRMSAAGRKAIAEGQRKRWAEARSGTAPEAAERPKRKLSPAGRAAIVAALKKRWAEKKAETSPAKKKSTRTKAA
jgi:hypothetical protein